MINVLFATTNHGKVMRYKKYYTDTKKINFYSCNELNINLPNFEEDGKTETENAIIKAHAFQDALIKSEVELPKGKWVVISLDTGLYFDKVSKLEQPGTHVKRIAGAGVFGETPEQTFQKMSTYYSSLARKYGSKLKGYFRDSYCVKDGEKEYCISANRYITLTDTMYTKDINFPVASYFKVGEKYYHELDDNEYKDFLQPSFDALDELLAKVSVK